MARCQRIISQNVLLVPLDFQSPQRLFIVDSGAPVPISSVFLEPKTQKFIFLMASSGDFCITRSLVYRNGGFDTQVVS